MVSDNQIRLMLPVREVARLLNIHSNTLRRWSDRGIIRAYRINQRGDRRFRQEDVVRILWEFKANGGSPKKAEPQMRDQAPSRVTLEGAEPQTEVWPVVKKHTPATERVVYPGAGSELFHGKKMS